MDKKESKKIEFTLDRAGDLVLSVLEEAKQGKITLREAEDIMSGAASLLTEEAKTLIAAQIQSPLQPTVEDVLELGGQDLLEDVLKLMVENEENSKRRKEK